MKSTKTLEDRRRSLRGQLETLEAELVSATPPNRRPLAVRIERIRKALRDLALDQRNESSMDGGSEA